MDAPIHAKAALPAEEYTRQIAAVGHHRPAPWPDFTALPVRAGDARVRLNGAPPAVDCRIISEANYQFARSAVNAIEAWKVEEQSWKEREGVLLAELETAQIHLQESVSETKGAEEEWKLAAAQRDALADALEPWFKEYAASRRYLSERGIPFPADRVALVNAAKAALKLAGRLQ